MINEAHHDADLVNLALSKMSPVLGKGAANALLHRLLLELRLELQTHDDLYHLGQAMAALSGFEGAVGSMVSLSAVLRGARPQSRSAAGDDGRVLSKR